jgi:hypothetical protein
VRFLRLSFAKQAKQAGNMKGRILIVAFAGLLAVDAAAADAAMPRKFAVSCDAGRFGHGRSEAAARSDMKANAARGPQYRDVYEFDLDTRQTRTKWADGKRVQSRAMTAVTADTIEIYNYRLVTVESVRTFHFPTMLNTSITHFTSQDPDYAWAVTEQLCAMAL